MLTIVDCFIRGINDRVNRIANRIWRLSRGGQETMRRRSRFCSLLVLFIATISGLPAGAEPDQAKNLLIASVSSEKAQRSVILPSLWW